MSLVSEALRKARQEAAAREGRGRGIPRAFALPPKRWRSGPRLVLALMIVLAAGLGGAGIAWWALSRHAGATPRVQASGRPAPAMEGISGPSAPASAPTPSATVVPAKTPTTSAPPAHEVPALAATTASPGLAPIPSARSGPPEETTRQEPPAVRSDEGSRERSFVIDANLGYAKLHLDYIVYRPGSPFARINGAEVMVGSVLDGFTVEEITDELVRLRDKHGVVILRVR